MVPVSYSPRRQEQIELEWLKTKSQMLRCSELRKLLDQDRPELSISL